MKDIIIVGRGLAGATLSFQLLAKGIKHRIIDKPVLSSSSKVAAGLVNPIVLKRLKMVHGSENFMQYIPEFYQTLEHQTKALFYNDTSIHHIFASTGEVNLWEEKKDLKFHSTFLKGIGKNTNPSIEAPFGLGNMTGVGWLHTNSYLDAHASHCLSIGIPIEEREFSKNEISSLAQSGSMVILCNGHLLKQWDLFYTPAFSPTRGEVMIIETTELPTDKILHSSIFSIPLGGNLFKIGATYHWDNLNDLTTQQGLQRLKSDLEKVYTSSYKVISHEAGVRPNTTDRKPLIGKIAPNLMVFNGMGSRAALMTPYLSSIFIDYLFNNKSLPEEYDVKRFMPK